MQAHQKKLTKIQHITMNFDHINIFLADGTHISAPLDWFPHLPNERIVDRAKWEAIRWWVWQHLAHLRHDKRRSQLLLTNK